MKTQIYSHHLYEVNTINDEQLSKLFDFTAKPRGITFNFHSENCFSVQNEHGQYLTAFDNGEVKFYATQCRTWEKFYILDNACQQFISQATKNGFKDRKGRTIQDFEIFIQNNKLFVSLGSTLITPSYFPAGAYECFDEETSIKYKTYNHCTILNKKRTLVYFCIYGKDEYYDMFSLSLKSLIQLGQYDGDILIKTDDIEKCQKITSEFTNKFHHTLIDEQLGIFNRYSLHEDILNQYDSIIYLDCDILTINHVNDFFNRLCEKADLLAYVEANNKTYQKEHSNKYRWWGADYLTYNHHIETEKYFMYNSGFFVINNTESIKPIFHRVIEYRQFETTTGDQPFFNLALYNSKINIQGIDKNDCLAFSRSLEQSFNALDKVFIHFNSGVGNLSKLDLMKSFYQKINE